MSPLNLLLTRAPLVISPHRTLAMAAGKKASSAVALKGSKMQTNKEKRGAGGGGGGDNHLSSFVKMVDSKERGTVSEEDMQYYQTDLHPLAVKYSQLCTKMHNQEHHNMQCKIDLKWNAREALIGSAFLDATDKNDFNYLPVARKIAMHSPPIKNFKPDYWKQKLAEEQQLKEEAEQEEMVKRMSQNSS